MAIAQARLPVGAANSVGHFLQVLINRVLCKSVGHAKAHHDSVACVIGLLNEICDVAKLIEHQLLATATHEVLCVLTKEPVNQPITFSNCGPARLQIHGFQAGLVRDIIDQCATRLLEQCLEVSVNIVKRGYALYRSCDGQEVYECMVKHLCLKRREPEPCVDLFLTRAVIWQLNNRMKSARVGHDQAGYSSTRVDGRQTLA
jgi:hypothetical protein